MISADLLLKGLAGVAAVGGATTVGVCYQQEKWIFAKKKVEKLSDLAGKVGLDCTGTTGQTDETGKDCTIKDGGLSVKQGDTNKETGKKKNTPQTGTEGKIRGYKDGKGFKFVIEDGDITLTGGPTNPTISKLEQFETYEIKEDGGDKKQYLTRKNEASKEIKLALGLPETNCDLPDATTTTKTCNLDETKIKKINFDGRKGELTLSGEGGSTLSLKISKPSADENTIFPHGYKFELLSNKDITLDTSKVIKKGTNTEFKIKVTPATGGPKVLTLEKAWNVKTLGAKVGLDCPDNVTGGTAGECSLTPSKVNVKNEASKKFENHSKKEDNDDKKVKFELDKEDHSQGIKFYAEQDISLKDSANNNGDDRKIEGKGNSNVSYEIKKDTGDSKWYLTKKAAAAGA